MFLLSKPRSFPLAGSFRKHAENTIPVGAPAADEIVELTLVLRRRQTDAGSKLCGSQRLTRDEHAELAGADPKDIESVESLICSQHLTVAWVHAPSRSIGVRGPLSRLAELFGASLQMRRAGTKVFRSRRGYLQVPEELDGILTGIFGFDTRPVASASRKFHQRSNPKSTFTPKQVAQAYHFPAATGKGETIALIELGGGFRYSDLQTYWQSLGVSDVPCTAVSVQGATNAPSGSPNSADGEVVLDIEVAGGVAPGAKVAVYFTPNTDQGFLGAIDAAIHDRVRNPSVISISWGLAEANWNPQSLTAFNQAFEDAAMLGITVCAASGDNGSSEGAEDGSPNVDFPASSPYVLACRGTSLTVSGGTITSETVWNDSSTEGATGGGISNFFPAPDYQSAVKFPPDASGSSFQGRGVPDVAAVADPNTGYFTLVDGSWGVVGGTSAVAPMWAGLIALLNEKLGKPVGYLHPKIYSTTLSHEASHDITE
jgi:kumamolisin